MISLAHIKTRLGQYAALWLGGFLLALAGILIGFLFMDLMGAIDRVLPIVLAAVGLGLGGGVLASLIGRETLGTKLAVVLLALLLVLPLLWAPVSAGVVIAFFADRSIEYSQAYAGFQIAVARLLFPIGQAIGDADLFGQVWQAFQIVSSVVGFLASAAKIWPALRRLLGPEPADAGVEG